MNYSKCGIYTVHATASVAFTRASLAYLLPRHHHRWALRRLMGVVLLRVEWQVSLQEGDDETLGGLRGGGER